ncbi:MAG: hypothetical protein HWE37_11450, partial [Rhodobacteraceae bacterium]|nr:hypothetical protein [Paracoccaceae bacterium]
MAHYVVTADFGLALDKEGISEAAWDALPTEQQELLQTTFDEMEETACFAASISGKEKDLAAWAEASGPDPVIDLDASSLAEQLAPLNERLAREVCGDGAWATLQSPGAARAVPAPTRPIAGPRHARPARPQRSVSTAAAPSENHGSPATDCPSLGSESRIR